MFSHPYASLVDTRVAKKTNAQRPTPAGLAP